MPSCGDCRYFRKQEGQAANGADLGLCRRRAPGGAGWPGTKASDWCGDWGIQSEAKARTPVELMLSKMEGVIEQLAIFDERLTALEHSVTAAQFEIARKVV